MRAELLERIQQAKNLTKVNLANMNITDDEIDEAIGQIRFISPEVSQFNLDANHLSDQGALLLSKSLRAFNVLTEISIQFNHIGRKGIQALLALKKEYPHLDVAFHGNQITDVGEMFHMEQRMFRG